MHELNKLDAYAQIQQQLDILKRKDISEKDIRQAQAVANHIGKAIKLALTEIVYEKHILEGGKTIAFLEDKLTTIKGNKIAPK